MYTPVPRIPMVAVDELIVNCWLGLRLPNTDSTLPVSMRMASMKNPPPSTCSSLLARRIKESLPTAKTTSLCSAVRTTSPPRMRVSRSACWPLTRTSPSRLKIDLLSGNFSGVLPQKAAFTDASGMLLRPAIVNKLTSARRRNSSSGCKSSSRFIGDFSVIFAEF